jgi:type II restriction enzyme
MLREPRPEAPITVPHRRARRGPGAAPERGPLEAQAQPPTLTAIDGGELTTEEQTEPRTHSEIQAKLRDIGIFEGYDVWVADRGTRWDDEELGTGCLTDLPVIAADRTRTVMKNIDVIWFRRGTGHPMRFFEIEHSTSVYSGLLRMNDVMIDFPITEAFIVGDGDKTQRKFEREIARRTFEQSRLKDVTQFLFYDQVRQTWQKYRSVGSGSKAWGSGAGHRSQQPAERR